MANGYKSKIVKNDTLVEMFTDDVEWFVDKTTTLGVDRRVGTFGSKREASACYKSFGREITD